jgi:hypothetical protein
VAQQVKRGPSVPYHLFDEEIEDEFVCSMVRAAQRVEDHTADWAGEYFLCGLNLKPVDLFTPRAKAIYEALLAVVEKGDVPSWAILRSHMLEAGHDPGATRTRMSYLLGMSTGCISAIPTHVERLQDLAAQRAGYAA